MGTRIRRKFPRIMICCIAALCAEQRSDQCHERAVDAIAVTYLSTRITGGLLWWTSSILKWCEPGNFMKGCLHRVSSDRLLIGAVGWGAAVGDPRGGTTILLSTLRCSGWQMGGIQRSTGTRGRGCTWLTGGHTSRLQRLPWVVMKHRISVRRQ